MTASSFSMDPTVTQLPLTIGVSTRAMFDLEEEHAVFEREGVHGLRLELQRAREKTPLKPGGRV